MSRKHFFGSETVKDQPNSASSFRPPPDVLASFSLSSSHNLAYSNSNLKTYICISSRRSTVSVHCLPSSAIFLAAASRPAKKFGQFEIWLFACFLSISNAGGVHHRHKAMALEASPRCFHVPLRQSKMGRLSSTWLVYGPPSHCGSNPGTSSPSATDVLPNLWTTSEAGTMRRDFSSTVMYSSIVSQGTTTRDSSMTLMGMSRSGRCGAILRCIAIANADTVENVAGLLAYRESRHSPERIQVVVYAVEEIFNNQGIVVLSKMKPGVKSRRRSSSSAFFVCAHSIG
ncbi:hypothetical protein KCU65_g433, partial [Aureobasidium melanogenum]